MMDRILILVSMVMGLTIGQVPEHLPFVQERFDCHHNYTEKEHHMGHDVWVTRKGAVRAREGDIALIPGSMGTPSYVVAGKGEKLSFTSAPHGAGRVGSRKQAYRDITMEAAREAMEGIIWGNVQALIDESPRAYKDITQVIADSADLVEITHTLTPLMNIKGY